MKQLDFHDWNDKYGESELDAYLLELDQEDSEYEPTDDDINYFLTDAYESYLGEYADLAYESYKDDLLFN